MADHGVEGYNNSGVSTQLVGDYIEVPHEKPWRYEEDGLTVNEAPDMAAQEVCRELGRKLAAW